MIQFIKSALLEEGMLNAKSIYDENGKILLRKGNHLTPNSIRIIKEKGYRGMYIEDCSTSQQAPLPEPIVDDAEIIKIVSMLMDMYNRKEVIEDAYDEYYTKHLKTLYSEIDILIDTLSEAYREQRLIFELSDGRNSSNWLYYHCVNTCLLSIAIGIIECQPREFIKDVAFAAMLHDMGKTFYDNSIVNKANLNTDEKKLIQGHVNHMYRLLQSHNFSLDVLQGVREHHEKIDGSGYPFGLEGDRIYESARIIAVANTYDNLTNINPYSEQKQIESEAVNHMSITGWYDQRAINALVKVVARYSVGTRVILSNGVSGIVVKNTMGYMERPAVATKGEIIELTDLQKNSSITIISVIDEFYGL